MATAQEARDWARDGLHGDQPGRRDPGVYVQTPMMETHGGEGDWTLVWDGKLVEAMDHARTTGMDRFELDRGPWYPCYPGRPDYFTHWGGAFKYAASVLGLPIGDHPHSRPPQAVLPDAAKVQIRDAYQRLGLLAD